MTKGQYIVVANHLGEYSVLRYDGSIVSAGIKNKAEAELFCDELNELIKENLELQGKAASWKITASEEISKQADSIKQIVSLKKENSKLKQAYTQLKHRHSLLHDECIDAECDRDSYRQDITSLEKENEELTQTIETICKDYEESHGIDIRNAEWFTAW